MEPDHHAIGNAIRKARLKAGLTLREAARRSGCSAAHLCDIEYGRRAAGGPKGRKIMQVVGYDPGAAYLPKSEK
jgi:transcriptional regulator with XRE-family HTH domain